ncbi:MAG: metallophosphoesterase [Dehalococcoidia bacterium]|jgi:DNA repair protein SbcD/Mre11
MKILHTADIHLRAYEDDRWKVLQKLIEIGKQEEVEIFVISGDLFNSDIDAENLKLEIRKIFSDTGFKIILIPGNHDSESYQSSMYFGADVSILTNLYEPFDECEDVRIWGLPFESIEGEKILSKLRLLRNSLTTDKKNILLYHGELLNAFFSRRDFGDEGEKRYMPVWLSYFKDLNIDYVLAGHFHSKFDIRELGNERYFVYPGSPISITEAEIGQRRVNIFEVGGPPKEYLLDTHHFEEVLIKFDPFGEKKPVEEVKERLGKVHPQASIILTIKGYIDGERIGISESELVKQIKEITKGKCAKEPTFEFRDIHVILEDDLFKNFMSKLEQCSDDGEKKKQLRDVAIRAMVEAKRKPRA